MCGGVDRAFLDGLLRIPSQCGDEPQLARVVGYTRDWLTARGVYCTASVVPASRFVRLQLSVTAPP